jgi:hypothetical protein
MGTGRFRARVVVPGGLLLLVLAVLAGPHGGFGAGSDRLGGVAVATTRTAGLPAVVHGAPHLVRAELASSDALPLGTLAALVLVVVGSDGLERRRSSVPRWGRLLAALRRGRGPPMQAGSTAQADV